MLEFTSKINEIGKQSSSLEKLAKSYPMLGDKELRSPMDAPMKYSLDKYICEIIPNKENGLRREMEVDRDLKKNIRKLTVTRF